MPIDIPDYPAEYAFLRRESEYHGAPCPECGWPVDAVDYWQHPWKPEVRVFYYECSNFVCGAWTRDIEMADSTTPPAPGVRGEA